MIRRIGVVCQDRNSFGFLQGIRRRLHCDAAFVEPTTGALGKSTRMTRRQANLAAADLRKTDVDVIIRLTDADRQRWQDIRRHEQDMFPDELRSIVICDVAVENTEQWLALDRCYLGQTLRIANVSGLRAHEVTGAIKKAISRARQPDEPVSEVAARIVADAPPEVFRAWLQKDESLRMFYEDCRAAALRNDCVVPNELEG